jgi:hypothetical protein
MLTQEHFSTVDRQGYIDAGVRAATKTRLLLDSCTSLCVGIHGPSSAGKSLFLDAVVHELSDKLSVGNIPARQHMILESEPDEAFNTHVTDIFNINAKPTKINFINVAKIWGNSMSQIYKLTLNPGITLFSFQHYTGDINENDLFETLPMSSLYKIDDSGSRFDRQWTAWHHPHSALRRARG